MHNRVLSGLVFTVFLAAFAIGQPPADATWHTLTSSSGEFSVSVPADYIVYSDKRSNQVTVAGRGNGAFFDTSFRKTGAGNESIEAMLKIPSPKARKVDFNIGDARIHTSRLEGEKGLRFSVYVATRKGHYKVSTTSLSPDNPTLAAILASVRLNDQVLLKDTKAQEPKVAATIKVNSLKSSDIIHAAMRRRQTEQVAVVAGVDEDPPHDRDKFYSRGLMVLQKFPARYNEDGRNNNVSGIVRLRILFKANGNIGRITVLAGLPFGLTEQAIIAAKQIKFLPAEINGIPADAEITLEYTFVIY